MMKEKSFTLVEILTIVGILIVLTALSVPAFRFFQQESDLNNSVEEIINTLRLAQNKTLSSEGASQYGVHFEVGKFVLFKGAIYNPSASDNEIHNLPKSVEIYKVELAGGGSEVVFNRVTGITNQSGKIFLSLETDISKTKTIYIENSGQVGLTSPSVPSDTNRVKDSRHVHFDLGWSIQNATTLKFYFPVFSQTETVNMANYFNTGKTEFDWDGTFIVGGINQEFRVYTHFITPAAFPYTRLCIHRDRNNGKNNQEVIIYIVDGGLDKDIAHYLADANDTVEKGFYVFNSPERQ